MWSVAGWLSMWPFAPLKERALLLRLPVELILKIFRLLDFVDILRLQSVRRVSQIFSNLLAQYILRKVSSRLNHLTKDRSLWLHLIQRYPTLPLASPIRNSLARLTAQELEAQLSHMLRLERNWATDAPTPIRDRQLSSPSMSLVIGISELCLIPGGRWLVVVDEWGEITLWDLDCLQTSDAGISIGQVVINDKEPVPMGVSPLVFDFTHMPRSFQAGVCLNFAGRCIMCRLDVPRSAYTPNPFISLAGATIRECLKTRSRFGRSPYRVLHLARVCSRCWSSIFG